MDPNALCSLSPQFGRDRQSARKWYQTESPLVVGWHGQLPNGVPPVSTHLPWFAQAGSNPTRLPLGCRTESRSRRDRRPVPRIDPGESGKMTGVVRGNRDDVARVASQTRLRCEDCISVERRRVGSRQPRVSDCRPELGCLVKRDLSYRSGWGHPLFCTWETIGHPPLTVV